MDKDALYTVCMDEDGYPVTGHVSVNAADQNISFNVISGLKNGEKIVEAMRSNITGSKISKKGYAKAMEEYGVREVVDTILNKCSSYIFFKTDLWKGENFPNPENEFDKNIGKIEEDPFIANQEKVYIQEFSDLVNFKISNMRPESYYKLGMNEAPRHPQEKYKDFWSYDEEMAEKMDPEVFFAMKIDENSYAGHSIGYEKAAEVSPMFYMDVVTQASFFDDLYTSLALEKAKELSVSEVIELGVPEISDICEKFFMWADYNDMENLDGIYDFDEDTHDATQKFIKRLLIDKIEDSTPEDLHGLITSNEADRYLKEIELTEIDKPWDSNEDFQKEIAKIKKIFYESVMKNISDIFQETLKKYKVSDVNRRPLSDEIYTIFEFVSQYIEESKTNSSINIEYILNFILEDNSKFELLINKYFSINLFNWKESLNKLSVLFEKLEDYNEEISDGNDARQTADFKIKLEQVIKKIKNMILDKTKVIFLEINKNLNDKKGMEDLEQLLYLFVDFAGLPENIK